MKPKRTQHHAPESPPNPATERQRLFCILGIASAVALVIAVFVVMSLAPRKLTDADRAAMRDYDQIRIALVHDDLANAKDAATAMIRDKRGQNPFHDSAVVITRANSLEEARSAFARMSERAQRLVKGNPASTSSDARRIAVP
jgi:hypothetical protein